MTTGNLDTTKYNAMVANAAARVTISSTVFKDFIADIQDKNNSNYAEAYADYIASIGLYRQALINGNFDVWQRGITQITSVSGATFPDRFSIASFAGNASAIKIDQGTLTPPTGSTYYLRYRLSTASAQVVSVTRLLKYKMESIDVQKLIGNQVTVSFKVRSNIARNFSYSLNVYGFTSVDNGIDGTGFIAGDGDYAQNTIGLTANTWTTVTKTFTMQNPASGTGLAANGISIGLWGRYTTTGAEIDTEYQFAQIQLNIGSVPLPFQPKSFAEELSLCQRYYETSFPYGTAPTNSNTNNARYNCSIYTAILAVTEIYFKTRKRIVPTMTFFTDRTGAAGTWSLLVAGVTTDSLAAGASVTKETGFEAGVTISGGTPGQAGLVAGHWVSDAEL